MGVKVAAQSMADVAAMGARPRALLVSLAAPGGAGVASPTIWPGGWPGGAAAGAAVVGGDVSEADQVVITGTALGLLDHEVDAVLRSGARAGDVVALAGVTGPSAAGLALLQAGGSGQGLGGPGGAPGGAQERPSLCTRRVRWPLGRAPTP